jgi:hypothetical protein
VRRARAALLLLLATLVSLEVGARVYAARVVHRSTHPLYRFNSYRVYEHIPGYREGEAGRDWIVINNQGFRRTTDTQTVKPPHTFRVILMGGSAAYGISSQNPYPIAHLYPEQTIDANLEQMLKTRHPEWNIEVINAAQTGYEVQQHTAYLESQLLDFDPDMVIFNDGVNDHYVDNPAYNYYRDLSTQFWKSRLQTPSLAGWMDYGAEWLGRWSALARLYSARRRVRDLLAHYDPTLYPQMVIFYPDDAKRVAAHRLCAARGFLRSVETNLMLLQAHHIAALVTRQPQLALRSESLLSGPEHEFMRIEDHIHNTRVLAPIVAEELSKVAASHNASFVDLVPVFNQVPAGQQLFIDYCHLTPTGARTAAAAMLPAAEQALAARESQARTGTHSPDTKERP